METTLTLKHPSWVIDWAVVSNFIKKIIDTAIASIYCDEHAEDVLESLVRIRYLAAVCFTRAGHKPLAPLNINGPITKFVKTDRITICQGKIALIYNIRERTIIYKVSSSRIGYLKSKIVIYRNCRIGGKRNESLLDVIAFMETYANLLKK